MTNGSAGVAVVATQVARSDRRGLSQAWYSALHLVERMPDARTRASHRAARPQMAPSPGGLPAANAARDAAVPRSVATPPRAGRTAAIAVERRRPDCETSRRVERAVARLVRRTPVAAAQTVAVDAGRVRLLVRRTGAATRIVAVCAPELRDAVERALAHARFALAAAGAAVR